MKNKFHLYPNSFQDIIRIFQIDLKKTFDPKANWLRWPQVKALPKRNFKYYRLQDKNRFEQLYANPKQGKHF